MANAFGIEYESPEEARARISQQYEAMKAQTGGNSLALANVAQQQAIFNLFGNQETQNAARKQELIGGVMNTVKKTPGEDEEAYQLRVATEIRNRAAKEHQDLALQANDQIIALQTQQQERRKLMADADVAETARDEKMWEFKNLKRPVIFGLKADGTKVALKRLGADATEDEIKAALAEQEAITGDKFAAMSVGNGMDEFNLDELDITESGYGLNKSTIEKRTDAITAGKVLFHSISDLSKELEKTPYILNPGSQTFYGGMEKIRGFWEAGKELLLGKTGLGEEEAAELGRQYDARIDAQLTLDDRYDAQAGNAGVIKARVHALAYQLAKTLDPGGRLSDQDIEMAKVMIMGNATPQDIARLFEKRVAETHEQLQLYLDEAADGVYGPRAKEEGQRYLANKAETIEGIQRLADKIKAERQGWDKEPAGAAPAAGGDNAPIKKVPFADLIRQATGG